MHTSLSRLTHRRNAVAAKLNSEHSSAAQPYVNQTPTCIQYSHAHKLTHTQCKLGTHKLNNLAAY